MLLGCLDFATFRSRGQCVCSECEMPMVALVVDDSMLIRHTVCRFLEERGFIVHAATNGVDALEKLKNVQPNLIVTDMQMPKMGGTELITALKAQSATAAIPIIIVAGRQSGFEKTEKRANFAIFKDIDIEDQLGNALQALLGTPEVKARAAAE
jgi:CheY-like chemotaxis protein